MGMTIEIHIRRSLLDRNPVRHLVWPKRAALNTTVRGTPCVMRNGFIGEGDATYFVDEKNQFHSSGILLSGSGCSFHPRIERCRMRGIQKQLMSLSIEGGESCPYHHGPWRRKTRQSLDAMSLIFSYEKQKYFRQDRSLVAHQHHLYHRGILCVPKGTNVEFVVVKATHALLDPFFVLTWIYGEYTTVISSGIYHIGRDQLP